jgi:uncharacterized protein
MPDNPVFRPGGVSYLRIPAPDDRRSAAFYHEVFDWAISTNGPHPSFSDGTGHVIGHFMSDLLVVGEGGVLPYVYVDDIDEAIARVRRNGGEIARQPYPEGDLWVATFRDPAGNVIGLWQHGPRAAS